MVGFNGVIRDDRDKLSSCILTEDFFTDGVFELKKTSNGKYINDKLFFVKEGFLFVLEGVITNSNELKNKYNSLNWLDAFYNSFKADSKSFYNEFRGSFCGLIYCLETSELQLFTDHLRTKDLFYTSYNNEFFFGTSLSELAKLRGKENTLDVNAAYLLLTFGATLEERTLFEGVKKLPYGSSLFFYNKEEIVKDRYFKLQIDYNNPVKKGYDQYINDIDSLFRQAIDRQFSKDKEYGYKHLVGLSAGRDSRMTTWVSHKMGYNQNVLNFTFSESEQLDEFIPKKIARELKNDWLFCALDSGNCLKFFEEVNESLCGELSLQNVLHGYSFMKNFNFEDYGMIHSGQVGDGIVNYYGKSSLSNDLMGLEYVQSKKLLTKVQEKNIISNQLYNSDEEFTHINRGIGVTLGSGQFIYNYTETYSPFTDIDLLNYCLRVPYNVRKGFKLYDDWMIAKYPESTIFSHNGRKIGAREFSFMGKSTTIGEFPTKVLKVLNNKFPFLKLFDKSGMNPMEYWYSSNVELRENIKLYFKENIDKIKDKELKEDAIMLFEKGNVGDKMQVITLLSALNLYFN